MFLYIGVAAIIGALCGIMYERYKWVRSVKKGKFVTVDGDLYNVSKVKVTKKKKKDEDTGN